MHLNINKYSIKYIIKQLLKIISCKCTLYSENSHVNKVSIFKIRKRTLLYCQFCKKNHHSSVNEIFVAMQNEIILVIRFCGPEKGHLMMDIGL